MVIQSTPPPDDEDYYDQEHFGGSSTVWFECRVGIVFLYDSFFFWKL